MGILNLLFKIIIGIFKLFFSIIIGIFKLLFAKPTKKTIFTPDFSKSDYDNWLEFVSKGGTTEQWEALKSANNWKFKLADWEIYEIYRNEVKPFADPYYEYLTTIQNDWSAMYQLKDYNGKLAKKIEEDCYNAIEFYKKMKEIDLKYNEKTPTNIPPFERLAMLYERQQRYEDCIEICKEGCKYGMNQSGRMIKAIKKAGREPNEEEKALIGN